MPTPTSLGTGSPTRDSRPPTQMPPINTEGTRLHAESLTGAEGGGGRAEISSSSNLMMCGVTTERCYPNYICSRIKLGEYIEKKMEEVAELIEEGRQFSDDSLAHKLLKRGYTLPATQLVGNTTTMQSILGYLMDDKIGRIGVYGMGGVGKTTIMKETNNQLLKESSRFDCVIWITVPKESNLEKLQDEIAKQVNLDLSRCEDVMQRGAELSNVLKRRKRFVLILDDMWNSFPLYEVGIPVPTLENGCKVVITTRSLVICRGMETDREVEVKVLSENEAWDLFSDKVGEQVLLSRDIQKIARNVVVCL